MSELRNPRKLPYAPPQLVIRDSGGSAGFPTVCAERGTEASVAAGERRETIPMRGGAGRALYQEVFFFCTVPSVGDVPSPGCIYVETAVDSETGCAFAKVYPAKNAMNAVEILASRVIPFFKRNGLSIHRVYTPKKPEYFGLVPLHPFETFLATSHIEHLASDRPGTPHNYICLQFYRLLQKKFFQPALREKFSFSLEEMQKDLDAFIDEYNAAQLKELTIRKNAALP
jgi:hypothetical protein